MDSLDDSLQLSAQQGHLISCVLNECCRHDKTLLPCAEALPAPLVLRVPSSTSTADAHLLETPNSTADPGLAALLGAPEQLEGGSGQAADGDRPD